MKNGISIYVHWPFCKSKCPYCDFNSHVRNKIDEKLFIEGYLKEIDYYASFLRQKTIKSIFFGGGTPSIASPDFFAKIIGKFTVVSKLASGIEITIEANPTSVEAEKFREFAEVGINRVSLGIQSLNSEHLSFLGREHSSREAVAAIDVAKRFFKRYSFDLIYALPEQSLKEWQTELEEALNYAGSHLSLYQLTIEKGTPFFADYRNEKFQMPNDDHAASMYEVTQRIMEANGMPQYEVSNHAVPGEESIHNMNYWEYGDYIGIGAGAHGRYLMDGEKIATVNHHIPEKWLKKTIDQGNAIQNQRVITSKEQRQEAIITGLRLAKGVDKNLVVNRENITVLLSKGFLKEDDKNYILTQKGRLVLNSIIPMLA